MRPRTWTHDRTHFFKYTTCAAASAILTSGSLRWSTPALFNDPFDAQFDLHAEIDELRAKELALEALWLSHYGPEPPLVDNLAGVLIAKMRGKLPNLNLEQFKIAFASGIDQSIKNIEKHMPVFHEEIRQHMKEIKLLCLTELNDNILMWSHYAEQHAGVVLELRCVPELDSPWGMAAPVEYAKKMPLLLDEEAFAALVSGQRGLDHYALTRRMVFTKAHDWNYEKEWRIFAGKGRALNVYEDIPFSVLELEAVYLGCRVPDQEARDIISIVRQKYSDAKLFGARKAERTFELVFTAID